MDERVSEFRRMVQRQRGWRPGRGARYPSRLRAEAVACAREGLRSGLSLSAMAAQLGVGAPTLSRWLETEEAGLREVEILAEAPPSTAGSGVGLVLVAPSGYRVEGLGLEQAVELLRVLG